MVNDEDVNSHRVRKVQESALQVGTKTRLNGILAFPSESATPIR